MRSRLLFVPVVSLSALVSAATVAQSPTETSSTHIAAPLRTARYGHAATLLLDGRVVVTGGTAAEGSTSSVEMYQPFTDTWADATSMSAARSAHSATLLVGGGVLVAGGVSDAVSRLDAEIYDAAANVWQPAGAMRRERAGHASVRLDDGTVLVIGGYTLNADGSATDLAECELYDPTGNEWTVVTPMNSRRAQHAALLLSDGKVLVVAGHDGAQHLATAEVFDPELRAWTSISAPAIARAGHSATLLLDGRILVAGGDDGSGGVLGTEVYDPVSDVWAPAASLSLSRDGVTATSLNDGRVLLFGGIAAATVGAELYDPQADAWTASTTSAPARSLHTATRLLSGSVLIAGGHDGTRALSQAEIWDVPAEKPVRTETRITAATPGSSTYGQLVTLTAIVSNMETGAVPTGSVQFFDKGTPLGDPVPVVNGQATVTTSSITVNNRLTAEYYPLGLFAGSTSATFPYVVQKASATSVLTLSTSPQQYSDMETFEATVSSATPGRPASSVTFRVGTQDVGTAPLNLEGTVYKARLTAALLESGSATGGQMAPTTLYGRVVTAVINGAENFTVPNATRAVAITKEDGRAAYNGALLPRTASPSDGRATVALRAIIRDVSATADAGSDTSGGDIRNASVTFYDRETGVSLSPLVPVALSNSNDKSTGTASHTWSVDIGTAYAQTFRIGMKLAGYYNRSSQVEDALVTVAKPLASGFLAGNGYLTLAASTGLKPGNSGSINDLGFAAKYNGSGTSPSGHFQTIVRSGGSVYHVKGATITSLVVTGKSAVLKGRASIYDITTGLVLVDGAATFDVTMRDNGTVGDTIAITVRNGAGVTWFSSGAGIPQPLTNGNISLP